MASAEGSSGLSSNLYSRLAMLCSIFCGIGGRLWAGAEVPGVAATVVDERLGPGV